MFCICLKSVDINTSGNISDAFKETKRPKKMLIPSIYDYIKGKKKFQISNPDIYIFFKFSDFRERGREGEKERC